MVEMTETANILHNATARSLVLMDEVGRGTSTFDGLSLAWASAEYIAERLQAWTLFATHYFELTALPERHGNIANVHLDASEHQDGIVFLHAVKPGPANQSYGLQVAQLAGVPLAVIRQAQEKLQQLERETVAEKQRSASTREHQRLPQQKELFLPNEEHPAITRLSGIDPDHLTARQALDLIYDLKRLLPMN